MHTGILELEDTLKQQTQKLANFKDRVSVDSIEAVGGGIVADARMTVVSV